jgi:hypothetical protein
MSDKLERKREYAWRTAKTLYRKFKTNIPRNETEWPRSHHFLHSCIWEYLNRSQIHESGNWEQGRAVSFLGIHKSDIVCSVPAPIGCEHVDDTGAESRKSF